MCLIIDTNVIAKVFAITNKDHGEFKPVLDFLLLDKGKVVYGGTKYLEEIGSKYVALFKILGDINKAQYVNSATVDAREKVIDAMVEDNDFDDPHLVALLKISGCLIIATNDKRANSYFTSNQFFKGKSKKPRIYSSSKNADLLRRNNLYAKCCGTPVKLKKVVASEILDNLTNYGNK